MVKPMPGKALAPSLAESWTASEDGLHLRFRAAQRASNSTTASRSPPRTSSSRSSAIAAPRHDDEGAGGRDRDPRCAACALQVEGAVARFPDLLRPAPPAPAGSCPKKYVEKVGDDGFKKGADRRRARTNSSRSRPGVELVIEAFEGYWRKTPSVKRIVFKVIPEESTRLAALKRGEVDIAYSIRGELAEELQHTPGLTLKPVIRRRRSGSISPSSGTRNRRGTTCGCGRPPTSRSTATASTRR